MNLRSAAVAALLCCPVLGAQEVRYIDLTAVEQRTELRYPPAAGSNGPADGSAAIRIVDAAADIHDPHALGVFVTHRTANQIDPTQPFQVEFKVVNTGTAPIPVPVSPHLSDLQPTDDSVPFHYLSLALYVSVVEDRRSQADVRLYGAVHRDGTIVTLQPGEWIRVTAEVKFNTPPAAPDESRLDATFLLKKNTWHPHPGGSLTEMEALYTNVTPTPPLKVFWLGATPSP